MSLADQGGASAALQASDYPEGLQKAFVWNDVPYAMPKDIDTIAVFYNKKLFKDAGVAEPTSDWTWDDMVTMATKITDANKGKGIYGICAAAWDQGNILPVVYANGGKTIAEDMKSVHYTDPETQEGFQMWVDLITKGISPNMKQMTDTHSSDWFKSGRIGIMWGGSFDVNGYATAPALKGNLGIVEMPLVKGKRVSMSNGLGPAVYAKTKNKDAAAALAAFISGPEAQKIWTETVVPSLKSVHGEWEAKQKALGVDIAPFLKATEYAQLMPRSKNSEAWGTPAWDVLASIWDLKTPVPAGMAKLQEVVTKAIAKEK